VDPRELLPLHPFELRILFALLDGPSHGYRIVKGIEERDGAWARIFPGNLYHRIRDLTTKGLVEESEPRREAGDARRRRYFEITPLGREVARAEALRLEDLVREARKRRLLPRPQGSS
jgi:DNA-binding PadR family transcriptional regulator